MFPPRLLGLVDEDPPEPARSDRLVRVETEVDAETPQRFLSRGEGLPRAFWGSSNTWHAGLGQARSIELPAEESGPERFETVRERGRQLSQRLLTRDGEPTPLRLFGGLSFHDRPELDPVWDAFGAARFTVPALELAHTPGGTRLIGTARVPEDWDDEDALDRAEQALEHAAEILERPPPAGPTEYQPPTVASTTDRDAWEQAVQQALESISQGAFEKVVLARSLDLDAGDPDLAIVLGNLRQANPGTHLFLVEPEPGRAFLGAAPELVASKRGTTFTASAVAGSIERGADEAEDDRLARSLVSSTKDRDEHEIVVSSMRERLARLTDHVRVARDTSVLRLASIQHLERDLYARVGEDQHVLDLLADLHPTPAVCGHPREPARMFLREEEPFERGWYAGPVGWFDTTGDGTFAPALRSGVLDRSTWRLFAGAGIVEGSKAPSEWSETGIKFRPVLDALGVLGVPET